MSESTLLTARNVAALLNVSQRHIWKLLSSGRLPQPVRLGRSVRWRRDELTAWMDAGCPPRDAWLAGRTVTP